MLDPAKTLAERNAAADLRGIAMVDTKVMRKIVALRRRDHAERKEEEAIMDLYLEALGMAG